MIFPKLPTNITSTIYWSNGFYSTFVNFNIYFILIYFCPTQDWKIIHYALKYIHHPPICILHFDDRWGPVGDP